MKNILFTIALLTGLTICVNAQTKGSILVYGVVGYSETTREAENQHFITSAKFLTPESVISSQINGLLALISLMLTRMMGPVR